MNKVVLFIVFLFGVSTGDLIENCKPLLNHGNLRCCSGQPIHLAALEGISNPDDFKECWEIHVRPPSCARDECVGKKLGYYKDGLIDLEAMKKIVEKSTESNAELQTLFIEKCLKPASEISQYGMPGMCDLAKMKMCFLTQVLKKCPQWSDEINCQETKQLVEECSTIM